MLSMNVSMDGFTPIEVPMFLKTQVFDLNILLGERKRLGSAILLGYFTVVPTRRRSKIPHDPVPTDSEGGGWNKCGFCEANEVLR